MLLRLTAGLWGGWRLRRSAQAIRDGTLLEALSRQARILGLKSAPWLAYCEQVAVPTVIGVLKPTILLPLAITSGLSPDQAESVLAHELAHLKRYDHLVNLLQRIIESLLFFHPAVWWISHRIRIEREHCCDDLVVACGAAPIDYATSLLRVAELSRRRFARKSFSAVSLLATDGKPSTLRQRIARLLGDPVETPVRLRHRWPVVVITACLLMAIWGLNQIVRHSIADQPGRNEDAVFVIEWMAVIDANVLDELKKLKTKAGDTLTSKGHQTFRWSANDLRAALKLHLGTNRELNLPPALRFMSPTPSAFRKTGVAYTHSASWSAQLDERSGNDPVSIMMAIGGFYFAETRHDTISLKIDFPNLHIDLGGSISNLPLKVETTLTDDEAIATVFEAKPAGDWKPSLLLVHEVVRVPENDAAVCQPLDRLEDWIRFGKPGLAARVARIQKWHQQSQRLLSQIDPKWTREVPQHGGKIELVALSRPRIAPGIYWTPDGQAIDPRTITSGTFHGTDDVLIPLVRVWEPERNRSSQKRAAITKSPDAPGSQFSELWLDQNPDADKFTVGAGFGPWANETRIAARVKAVATLGDEQFQISSINDHQRRVVVFVHPRPIRVRTLVDLWMIAVTKDRKTIEPSEGMEPRVYTDDKGNSGGGFWFDIPVADIDHFVLKSRPVQWVQFEGFRTAPPVKEPTAAHLPNGIKVELVGLAAMESDPRVWWNPDGSLRNEIPDHGRETFSINGVPMRRALVRVHGVPSYLDVVTPGMNSVRTDQAHGSGGPFVRVDGGLAVRPNAKTGTIEVGVATEPLCPIRVLGPTGETLPRPADAPEDPIREDIQIVIVNRNVSNNTDRPEWTDITWRCPAAGNRPIDLQLNLIDSAGQSHEKKLTAWSPDRREVTFSFDVPFQRVDRFEYRMRLFRHWVSFENVSLNPDERTEVNVKVDENAAVFTPPVAGAEQNPNDSRQPTSPTRLRVLNADGTRARWFNDVVKAEIGLLKSPTSRWVGSPDRDGMISLADLPAGSHWLLAAGDFPHRTLFSLELPSEEPTIEQQLRAGPAWNVDGVDVKASVENVGKDEESIVFEIHNQTQKALTVSEADVQLQTERPNDPRYGGSSHGEMIRGLSPRWATQDPTPFAGVTVDPGQTGRLRLQWRDWFDKGLWAERTEPIDEPALPPPDQGKLWIRPCLGNSGALPVSVTLLKANPVAPQRRDRVQRLDGRADAPVRHSSLTIHVDSSGDATKEMIHVKSFDENREIGSSSNGRLTYTDVENPGTLIVENLAAGEYEVSRIRMVSLFKYGTDNVFSLPRMLDARRVRLDQNDKQTTTIAHPNGKKLSGRIVGIKVQGLDFVSVHVCEVTASAVTLRTGNETCYDVAVTDADGNFATEPISPGRYKLLIAGYKLKDPKHITPSDIDFPRYFSEKEIEITESAPPEAIELTLAEVDEKGR